MGAPEHPSERRDPHVVLRRPVGGAIRREHAHRSELQHLERCTVPTCARLSVEQRSPVGDEVPDRHERRHQRQRDEPERRERDVEETLHARVARGVQLADVEQQRHALELADRELAEPLFVEERHRADPHAVSWERRCLQDDVVVRLRGPAENQDRRPAPLRGVDERVARRNARQRGLDGRQPANDDRRSFRGAREVGLQRLPFVAARDDDHTVALFGAGLSVM